MKFVTCIIQPSDTAEINDPNNDEGPFDTGIFWEYRVKKGEKR